MNKALISRLSALALLAASAVPALADDGALYEVHDWSGFYAGVYAGYGIGATDNTVDAVAPPSYPFHVPVGGAMAGVVVGANAQFDSVVVGVEADAAWSGINGGETYFVPGVEMTSTINWNAGLRGRIGYTFDDTLVYATGGLAVAEIRNAIDPFPNSEKTAITPGWSVGAGIEQALSDNLSIKGEYLYTSYNTIAANPFEIEAFATTHTTGVHAVKVGLNFHF